MGHYDYMELRQGGEMEERKPMFKMDDAELQHYEKHGSAQERHIARTILMNRQLQRTNPTIFAKR